MRDEASTARNRRYQRRAIRDRHGGGVSGIRGRSHDGEDAETAEYRNPDEPTTAEPVTIASITIPFGPFAFERDVRLEESK